MSVPEIDFHKIRPHRNTRHGGFEELSVQLFRTEAKSAIEFTRIEGAGGDGGVEAFATLKDGSEIGLQSKFFERLGTNQWQQLQKSVKSALANHARLAEYRIVVPLNRTPANKRKWDTVVKEWQTLAKKTGFRKKLRFTWWGASELEHFLTTPEHSHKLLYWFGCHQFSDNWIDTQNQAALADLDCRYTPQHHVLTASEKFLHAVARTEQFSADFYKRVRNLFNASRKLSDGIQRDEQLYQLVRTEYETFSTVWRTTSGDFGNGKTVPLLKKISELCNLLRDAGEPLRVRIAASKLCEYVVEEAEMNHCTREDGLNPKARFRILGLIAVPKRHDMGDFLVCEVGQFANSTNGDVEAMDAGSFDLHWDKGASSLPSS